MKKPYLVAQTICVVALASFSFTATAKSGASYPTRPIRIIVPSAPGGTQDIVTRLVAEKMAKYLGQSIVIENRAGADTLIGTRIAKEAPADGYTVLSQANGFTILPDIKSAPGYDPLRDFTGVGLMTRSPYFMVVGADSTDRTVLDFVKRAKTSSLTFASGGIGAPPHVSATLFMKNQGIKLTNILYKGNAASYADVVAGRVSMMFGGYEGIAPFLKSGKLRALAVSSSERIPTLPNVPTFIEQGVNYKYTLWLGLLVRSGTPPEIVSRLSQALHYALADKSLKERFAQQGADSSFVSPSEFNAYLTREVTEMKKLAHTLNFQKK